MLAEVDVTPAVRRLEKRRSAISVAPIVEQQLNPPTKRQGLVPRTVHLKADAHLGGMGEPLDRGAMPDIAHVIELGHQPHLVGHDRERGEGGADPEIEPIVEVQFDLLWRLPGTRRRRARNRRTGGVSRDRDLLHACIRRYQELGDANLFAASRSNPMSVFPRPRPARDRHGLYSGFSVGISTYTRRPSPSRFSRSSDRRFTLAPRATPPDDCENDPCPGGSMPTLGKS